MRRDKEHPIVTEYRAKLRTAYRYIKTIQDNESYLERCSMALIVAYIFAVPAVFFTLISTPVEANFPVIFSLAVILVLHLLKRIINKQNEELIELLELNRIELDKVRIKAKNKKVYLGYYTD